MSQSGVSEQVISLPTGGGAVEGIGETFSADLFTGTGNHSVPIAVPPGRNGFQPQLALSYSTGNGNGPFGMGWALSVPGVTRKSSDGVPRYASYDDPVADWDTFVLSGAEDLVPVDNVLETTTKRVVTYRPRTEGLFARIRHIVDPGVTDYWEVTTKDGMRSIYGTENAAGADPAAIADPTDPSKVFSWRLSRTIDTFGNEIQYTYVRDREDGIGTGFSGEHVFDQLYIDKVLYSFDKAATPNHLASVSFTWDTENTRKDSFTSNRAGFSVRTRRRCTTITTATHVGTTRNVRSYNFTYVGEADPEFPLNGTSLLASITVKGLNSEATGGDPTEETLPPLEFKYTELDAERRTFQPVSGPDLPIAALSDPDVEFADLTGDGLPDLMQFGATVRYWRNRGGGRFDVARSMPEAPTELTFADPDVRLLDVDGDGRIDLYASTPSYTGTWSLDERGRFGAQSFRPFRRSPSFSLADPRVAVVDLSGDGTPDVLRSSDRFEYYAWDRDEGFAESPVRYQRGPAAKFPDVDLADERVRWADMTGDGLQDIVFIHRRHIEYWASQGHGRFSRRVAMRNAPNLPRDYEPSRLLIGDVDGDGLADLVYVENGAITVWFNQGGNGYSEGTRITGLPDVTDIDTVRLIDLLGTGTRGVLWSRQRDGWRDDAYFFDLTGQVKPYVLREVDNNLGALTRVYYGTSTAHRVRDDDNPATRWKTFLPFPVQVVDRVEVFDLISKTKQATEYTYRNGYWDGVEREFRGFVEVLQRDTQEKLDFDVVDSDLDGLIDTVPSTSFAPPTESRSWFHPGPLMINGSTWEDPGSLLEIESRWWSGDLPKLADAATDSDALGHPSVTVRRDALRTLRGSLLRTELYSFDGSSLEDRPWSVTESVYGVRYEETELTGGAGRRIHFPYLDASRSTAWERGSEPKAAFSFNESFDDYGHVTSSTSAAIPRLSGEAILATGSTTEYATPLSTGGYIYDRPCSATSWELTGQTRSFGWDDTPTGQPAPSVFSTLRTALADALDGTTSGARELIGHAVTFYDGEDAFKGLAYGQVENHGVPVRTETLVHRTEDLEDAYGVGNIPSYVTSVPSSLPAEYGAASGFASSLPISSATDSTRPNLSITSTGTGYNDGTSESTTGFKAGYYVASSRVRYDDQKLPDGTSPSGDSYGLVQHQRDPLGNDTEITFDMWSLLPIKVTAPNFMIVDSANDYRLMRPYKTTDPNGNVSHVVSSPLGFVTDVWVVGPDDGTVGDTTAKPSRTFRYDLDAWYAPSGGASAGPVWVESEQREYHANELTGVPASLQDRTIIARQYSDGFGRVVQTVTQSDEVRFGDATHGLDTVPLDPDTTISTTFAGTENTNTSADLLNTIISGWTVYDNKGQAIEQFEPFYGTGFDFVDQSSHPSTAKSVKMTYDPLGRVVETLRPDGAKTVVVYGTFASESDIDDLTLAVPTPWEQFTYDPNDNAGRTHSRDGRIPTSHHDTPASVEVDALGRTVLATVRIDSDPAVDNYVTRTTYDIRGNVTKVVDTLGRTNYTHVYDLANRPLKTWNIDAGETTTVLDAVGNVLEQRDARDGTAGGALVLHGRDELHRPRFVWARDDSSGTLTKRNIWIYWDSAGQTTAQARNGVGRLRYQYDEAGRLTFESYDYKGNPVDSRRSVFQYNVIAADLKSGTPTYATYQVDWDPPSGTSFATHVANTIETSVLRITKVTYDALNRPVNHQYPRAQGNGVTTSASFTYNRAGLLKTVKIGSNRYVDRISYNARGQRNVIVYGNGTLTRYAYDADDFRLMRMRTDKYSAFTGVSYTLSGVSSPVQDFMHAWDLVGNVRETLDLTPGCGVLNNSDPPLYADAPTGITSLLTAGDAIARTNEYDALYRLTSAKGRNGQAARGTAPDHQYTPAFFATDNGSGYQANMPSGSMRYTETYTWDPVGNLLKMHHQRIGGGAWARYYGVGGLKPETWDDSTTPYDTNSWRAHLGDTNWTGAPGNQMTNMGSAATATKSHHYDGAGHLLGEGTFDTSNNVDTGRAYEWNAFGRMKAYKKMSSGTPQEMTHYLYDASGQRVSKIYWKGGTDLVVTHLVGGNEHIVHDDGINTPEKTNHLHLMDDSRRIATRRMGPDLSGAPTGKEMPVDQFRYGDLVESCFVVLDRAGTWVNREEYSPFGETTIGGYARKRYRFNGKERDEESGLGYYGFRYYAPWMARWTRTDPAGPVDGLNLYQFVRGNPTSSWDPSGLEACSILAGNCPPPALVGKDVERPSLPDGWSIHATDRGIYLVHDSWGQPDDEILIGLDIQSWAFEEFGVDVALQSSLIGDMMLEASMAGIGLFYGVVKGGVAIARRGVQRLASGTVRETAESAGPRFLTEIGEDSMQRLMAAAATGGDELIEAQVRSLSKIATSARNEMLDDVAIFLESISHNELITLQNNGGLARAFFGTHLEMRVAAQIDELPAGHVLSNVAWTGRGNGAYDFIDLTYGHTIELTTDNLGTLGRHLARPAVDSVSVYPSLTPELVGRILGGGQ